LFIDLRQLSGANARGVEIFNNPSTVDYGSNGTDASYTGGALIISHPSSLFTNNPAAINILGAGGTSEAQITADGQFVAGGPVASINGVSVASFSFIDDPNTGMYSSSADTLSFSTNGLERARFNTTGAFMVGTSTAYASTTIWGNTNGRIFEIANAASTTLFAVDSLGATTTNMTVTGTASTSALVISNTGGTGTRCLQVSANGTVSANASACGTGSGSAASKWATSTTDTLAIYSAGAQRVGIGTSTPKWSLQIASSTGPQLALSDTSGTSNPWTFRSINGNLFVATASPSTFATSSNTALSITSNGRVGIASTTPLGLLSISNTLATSSPNFSTTSLAILGGNILHEAYGGPLLLSTLTTTGAAGVYVSGKYAYVADGSPGIQIIDVSNPAATPVLVSTLDTVNAQDVFVSGKYAYVADGSAGVQIVDISNPITPLLVGNIDTNAAFAIYVSGKYAYVADNTAGLKVIDVSNPTTPTLVSTLALTNVNSVYVSGKYAYMGDVTGAGLQIIDISNPVTPVHVGVLTTTGAYDVYISGKYAYVADSTAGLKIIDVSNPAAPTLVGSVDTNEARGVYVSGKYAYVADGSAGVQIVDISNPTTPLLVGNLDTTSAQDIYISGKYAYLADNTAGLRVLDINGMETPSLYAGNIETNVLNVTENVNAGGDIFAQGGLHVGRSGIFSAGAIHSFFTATTSLANQYALSGTVLDNQLSAVSDALSITHTATGTIAAGIGTGLLFSDVYSNAASNVSLRQASSSARIASVLTNISTSTPFSDLAFYTKNNSTNSGLAERMRLTAMGNLGIGTSTPFASLQIATTTGKNLVLSDSGAGTNLKHWLLSSRGGDFYLSTSTDALASSTLPALAINSLGIATFGKDLIINGNSTTTNATT
jgi:hypothetical protein